MSLTLASAAEPPNSVRSLADSTVRYRRIRWCDFARTLAPSRMSQKESRKTFPRAAWIRTPLGGTCRRPWAACRGTGAGRGWLWSCTVLRTQGRWKCSCSSFWFTSSLRARHAADSRQLSLIYPKISHCWSEPPHSPSTKSIAEISCWAPSTMRSRKPGSWVSGYAGSRRLSRALPQNRTLRSPPALAHSSHPVSSDSQ